MTAAKILKIAIFSQRYYKNNEFSYKKSKVNK